MSVFEKYKGVKKYDSNFNIRKIAEKYNKMTDKQWEKLIKKAARKDYDISPVREYRRQYGDSFDIMNFSSVFDCILKMNGHFVRCLEDEGNIPSKEEANAEIRTMYKKYGMEMSERK